MDLPATALTAGISVVTATVTAWLVPWPKWSIEKRRRRHERRRNLINIWRSDLIPIAGTDDQKTLQEHPSYSSLEGHLSPEFLGSLASGRSVILRGGPWLRSALTKEIARLERQWELI